MLCAMRSHHSLFAAALLTLFAGSVAVLPALADVVPPPPADCPEGTTPRTSHYGPYCEPPPPESCPPGHLPLVYMDKAFCEPPPPVVCPPGSFWTSKGPDNLYCHGGRPCEEYPCPEGHTCTESSLCVRQERQFRMMYEVVSKICEADGDCDEGETCVSAKRCDPVDKRQPADPADPAAGDAPAVEPGADPAIEPPAPAAAEEAVPVADDGADADEVEPKGCSVGARGPRSGSLAAALVALCFAVVVRRH